jgi:adenine-specific DNA-methyltransferase
LATLNFKGKTFVQNHHLTVKYHQLIPKKDQSLTDKVSLNDNLIIHGDNLKALKALLPTYANKVKCIYIDPPYNTGNEKWVYNDNVNSPMMQEWLGKVVDREDLTRHDKWLCMMMPRLKLLRELLKDDGVIFVSIDDNEQHNLRYLMDEIFGDNNFVTNIIWHKKYSLQSDAKYFSDTHDFILCYAKNKLNGENKSGWIRNLLPRTEKQDKLYRYDNHDGKGLWRSDNLLVKSFSETYVFPITNPKTKKEYYPPKGSCWRASKETIEEWIKENRVFFGRDDKGAPQLKRYLNEVQQGIVPTTLWSYEEVGHTDEANKEVRAIFHDKSPIETPKPTRLIKRILQLSTDKDSIILDSFAGSGTTAHAVLDLNKQDGGNRKYILVECEDYADKITAERVRRVIKGVKGSKDEKLKEGLGGTFSYFELGEPIEMESILEGNKLPSYLELARYVFYTATGEEFSPKEVNEKKSFIGESREYEVYLFYKPDIEYLKSTALTLERAKGLGPYKGKKRLVFAPSKYLDMDYLLEYRIDYCQLPFEIYKLKE